MPKAGWDLGSAVAQVLGDRGPVDLSDLTAEVRKVLPTITRSDVRQHLIAGTGDRYAQADGGWSLVEHEVRPPELSPTTGRARSSPGRSKQSVVDELCSVIGIGVITLGPGSTEPKRLLVKVADVLGLHVGTDSTKLDIARQIVTSAGHQWLEAFDSTTSESGGGGTITTDGILGVLEAAKALRPRGGPPVLNDALAGNLDLGAGPKQRNPTWVADELILGLDLYVTAGMLGPADPRVIELSELLNTLPIHEEAARRTKFRNPKAVGLKLANFAALDPAHPGRGMEHGSKGDRDVWERFAGNQEELAAVAGRIRELVTKGDPAMASAVDEEESVVEGRLLFRAHRSRERDPAVAARKRAEVMARDGALRCEGCGFDFAAAYGSRGEGFIEVHHLLPLSVGGPRATRLSDLVVLCANCHRMVHRREPWLELDQLQGLTARD